MSEEPERQWTGNRLSRFLAWCSGARLYLLRECPSDANIYIGVGAVVVLKGLLACFSGGYAVWMIFESLGVALAVGLFWGVMVFALDWFLVASLRKEERFGRELLMALPRFLLSLVIAVVVAYPIEMRLFESEIEARMAQSQLARRAEADERLAGQFAEIEQLRAANDSLMRDVDALTRRRDRLFDVYIAEAEGTGGTGKAGKGSVFREKKAEYDRAQADVEEMKSWVFPRIEENRERIRFLQRDRDQLLATNQMVISRSRGFLSRYNALGELKAADPAVDMVGSLIMLLFVLVEISPILVKLLIVRGAYDDLLAFEQMRVSARAKKGYSSVRSRLLRELDDERSDAEAAKQLFAKSKAEAYAKLIKAQDEVNEQRIAAWRASQINNVTGDVPFPELVDLASPAAGVADTPAEKSAPPASPAQPAAAAQGDDIAETPEPPATAGGDTAPAKPE